MNPFLDLSVLPMYGQTLVRLVWRVQSGYETGRFAIFKSPDGINNWREIGHVPGKAGGFVDNDLRFRGKWDETYYRVQLTFQDAAFMSDVVSTFGKLTRQEFGIARVIMEREWSTLKRFTAVKICKMRSDGTRCRECTDPDTGQRIGTSLCVTCYSTGFEGGYYPSIDSFMHVGTISTKVQEDTREGAGSIDPVNLKARLTAYPIMEKEDLIVDLAADRRYLIDTLDYGYYNGKVPVYAEAALQMLPRHDPRFQFPA